LGAYLLDGLIILLPSLVIYGLAAVAIAASCDTTTDVFGRDQLDCTGSGATVAIVVVLGIAAFLAVAYFYFIRTVARAGQTLGMKAANIRIVDAQTGGPIGTGRAIGRYLVRSFISGLVCYLGFLWMLWDDRSQTWHDKVANSVVVRT
jgi:uncharacterized RDD family membrane protein YckC